MPLELSVRTSRETLIAVKVTRLYSRLRKDGNMFASDVMGFLKYTRDVSFLDDNEIAW